MQLKNVALAFGTQEIFNDVSLQIREKEKIGVVGVNGAGKSTLFKLLLGVIEPQAGRVVRNPGVRVGFLPQVVSDEIGERNISVFEYLLEGRPIKKLEDELARVYAKAAVEKDEKVLDGLMKKVAKLQGLLEYYEEYNAENILLKIVCGMGIDDRLLDMSMRDLSGGQKSKVAFARILYEEPEVLMLDEPTNHLDQVSKDYVMQYLRNYKGTVLVISHDVEFLNEVTTQTLYVDKVHKSMELVNGNYEKYLSIMKNRRITEERLYEKQSKEEEKLKRVIAKYIRGNEKKARVAKDRQKKLARLEANRVVIEKEMKKANFKVRVNEVSGVVPISVDKLCFGYSDSLPILKDLTFDLSRGEKFLIVGENGVGKSTLLKLIAGSLQGWSGEIKYGSHVSIGYYAQEHEMLDNDKSILDNFDGSGLAIGNLRALLGNFLFHGDDVYKKVGVLSPGERSRVALAKLAISGANVLLLDEPTNHLDPVTQCMIAQVFKDYEGTMLVVSHNPEFVDNLGVERMLMLPEGEIRYYDRDTVLYYQGRNVGKL